MEKKGLWYVAKGLEGLGMILVLVGLLLSIDMGMRDQGLESMAYEGKGLMFGGGLFLLGWVLERVIGSR